MTRLTRRTLLHRLAAVPLAGVLGGMLWAKKPADPVLKTLGPVTSEMIYHEGHPMGIVFRDYEGGVITGIETSMRLYPTDPGSLGRLRAG